MNKAAVTVSPLFIVNLPNSRLSASSSWAGIPLGYLPWNQSGCSVTWSAYRRVKGLLKRVSDAARS